MATNNQHATHDRQPANDFERVAVDIGIELEGSVEVTVGRKFDPLFDIDAEPFEHLRDALQRETKLRLSAPDPWRPEKQTSCERSWTGRGHVVRLSKPRGVRGVLGSWTVTVDGEVTLEDASRLEAFKAAAERMSEISEHVRPTE